MIDDLCWSCFFRCCHPDPCPVSTGQTYNSARSRIRRSDQSSITNLCASAGEARPLAPTIRSSPTDLALPALRGCADPVGNGPQVAPERLLALSTRLTSDQQRTGIGCDAHRRPRPRLPPNRWTQPSANSLPRAVTEPWRYFRPARSPFFPDLTGKLNALPRVLDTPVRQACPALSVGARRSAPPQRHEEAPRNGPAGRPALLHGRLKRYPEAPAPLPEQRATAATGRRDRAGLGLPIGE